MNAYTYKRHALEVFDLTVITAVFLAATVYAAPAWWPGIIFLIGFGVSLFRWGYALIAWGQDVTDWYDQEATVAVPSWERVEDAHVVHNHGPNEGRGLACPEYTTKSGRLRGACIIEDEVLGRYWRDQP